jgi:uncharacterized protein (DUF3084 family)
MNKVEVIKVLAEDKTFENETKHKGNNDLEVKIKILQKEIDTLKAIINLKEIELTAKDDIINEVKEDNKKLAKQVEDLKKEAKDMLLYP